MAAPTNSDIYQKLIEITTSQAVQQAQLDRVETQAIKTNGRVNKIEEWQTGLVAVAAFQKEHPSQGAQTINAPNATTVQVVPNKWFQSEKLVGAVVVILTVLAGVLAVTFGVNQ
ncbi:hypothetical protein [Rathayibacter festucae]|uniref:Uncharacterized protein n=1 Tax=Rathayibacter festucae DSM 15932 TaxID=1328866 RepID=A0A3T0SYS2_9MICO|nr:hypothetical protein [Rathayibacter festucae]AZZ51435.1 hypothetical protein C1I64_04840 [Rathayibacter festucae DSM 15932]